MKIVVTKNAVRELLREAMMNPSVGWQSTTDLSDSPSTVSAVVDPSAAVTDPGNLNFKPSNRKELSVAISSIIDDISDDRAEKIFDAIKDAIKDAEEDKEMKDDKKVEETIRLAIRKMLKEAELPPVKKIPAGVFGGEWMKSHEKRRKDLEKTLMGMSDDDDAEEMERADAPAAGRARKNVMQTDVGGSTFDQIAAEAGYSSPSGAKQAVERILGTVKFRLSLPAEEVEIVVLTTLKDWLDELERSGASEDEMEEVRNDPTLMEDWEDFREHINKRLNKYEKAVGSGESIDDFLYDQAKRVSAHQRKYPARESVDESASLSGSNKKKMSMFIERLKASGKITDSDAELMQTYPEIANSLPGFKTFKG